MGPHVMIGSAPVEKFSEQWFKCCGFIHEIIMRTGPDTCFLVSKEHQPWLQETLYGSDVIWMRPRASTAYSCDVFVVLIGDPHTHITAMVMRCRGSICLVLPDGSDMNKDLVRLFARHRPLRYDDEEQYSQYLVSATASCADYRGYLIVYLQLQVGNNDMWATLSPLDDLYPPPSLKE